MTADTDGVLLSPEEFSAILMLGGKQSFYGFLPEREISRQELWSICCTLAADGLLVSTGAQFQLREDLYQVLLPILEARYVLVFRGSSGGPQVMYYLGRNPTAVEKTISGQYALRHLELPEILQELRLRVRLYDPAYPVRGNRLCSGWTLDTPPEQLAEKCEFLLTLVDMECRRTAGWLRGARQQMEPWGELCTDSVHTAEILTGSSLKELLEKMLEGVQK